MAMHMRPAQKHIPQTRLTDACEHDPHDYCPACEEALLLELCKLRNERGLVRRMPDGTFFYCEDQTDEDLLREFRADELRVPVSVPEVRESGHSFREDLRQRRATAHMEPGTDEWKRQNSW